MVAGRLGEVGWVNCNCQFSLEAGSGPGWTAGRREPGLCAVRGQVTVNRSTVKASLRSLQ